MKMINAFKIANRDIIIHLRLKNAINVQVIVLFVKRKLDFVKVVLIIII